MDNLIVSLEDMKEYLRVDFDDDNELITNLILAGTQYIQNATGQIFTSSNNIAVMCIQLLVANWYSNRTPLQSGRAVEIPYAISYLIPQLKYCDGGVSNGTTDTTKL